jgi:dynein heavy chain
MTVRFYDEMRRRYYTTPSSYLDLLKLYLTTLMKKTDKIQNMRGRIANGLNVMLTVLLGRIFLKALHAVY